MPIPRTITMTAGRSLRTIAKRSCNSCSPAPDVAAIAWKRAALKSGQHEHTDVKTERVERAIADDVAFLTSHPTRTKGLRKMPASSILQTKGVKHEQSH